jgi:DNA-binding winged helix-turn-helix (wHTH) protein
MLNFCFLMPEARSAGKKVRFGVFEVDLVSGELRKNGTLIRLQEQPFQVLAMLLERPGELVSRDDLRSKLWSADTFVDFDHSLNTAVNKLREALGDAATNPRFVQTIARRGYRFIAPVQESGQPIAPSPLPTPVLDAPSKTDPSSKSEAPQPAQVLHPELEVPIPRRGLTRALFLLIQVMYLIFYLEGLFHWQSVYQIAVSFLPAWAASAVVIAVVITAGVGIPLRCYLISAVAFDHRRFGENFRRIFPFLLAMDQLWAVAPFLLAGKIGFGPAFAATAALLYVPFSERTLVRLAYPAHAA